MQTQDQNCFRFAFVIIVIKERAQALHKLEICQNSNLEDSSHLEIFWTYKNLCFNFLQVEKQGNVKAKWDDKRIIQLQDSVWFTDSPFYFTYTNGVGKVLLFRIKLKMLKFT